MLYNKGNIAKVAEEVVYTNGGTNKGWDMQTVVHKIVVHKNGVTYNHQIQSMVTLESLCRPLE